MNFSLDFFRTAVFVAIGLAIVAAVVLPILFARDMRGRRLW